MQYLSPLSLFLSEKSSGVDVLVAVGLKVAALGWISFILFFLFFYFFIYGAHTFSTGARSFVKWLAGSYWVQGMYVN